MKAIIYFVLTLSILVSCEKKPIDNHEIKLKTDTILQKDGKVLSYTVFAKSLLKMKRDRSVYSKNYETRIAKLVEYYLDKTTLPDVKYQLNKETAKLGYSIEETDWEGVKYTQIGLFNRPNKNITTFLWLFYNPKTQELYEFDVPKNTPILFNYQ